MLLGFTVGALKIPVNLVFLGKQLMVSLQENGGSRGWPC